MDHPNTPRATAARILQDIRRVVAVASLLGLAAACSRPTPAAPVVPDLASLKASELPAVDADGLRAFARAEGRYLLVTLWASWCAPCVEEMPILSALADEFPDTLLVVGLGLEDPATDGPAMEATLRRGQARFRVGHATPDPEAFLEGLGLRWDGLLPRHLIIDPEGQVRSELRGVLTDRRIAQAVLPVAGLRRLKAGGEP